MYLQYHKNILRINYKRFRKWCCKSNTVVRVDIQWRKDTFHCHSKGKIHSRIQWQQFTQTHKHIKTLPYSITVTVPLISDSTIPLESEWEFWFWWNVNIWFDNSLFFLVSASFVWVHVNSCCWSLRHKQLKTEKGWPIPFSFKEKKMSRAYICLCMCRVSLLFLML